MKCFIYTLSVLILATSAVAKEGPDFQMRVPTHIQRGEQLGYAFWFILPDIAAEKEQNAFVVVGGVLLKREGGKGWIEVMGGARFNEDDYKDPLINVRFSDQHTPVGIFGDLGYFPRKKRERGYWLVFVMLPISKRGPKPRVGLESENIHYPNRPDSWGIGPRASLTLGKVSVALTYQIRNDRDFVRLYANLNL